MSPGLSSGAENTRRAHAVTYIYPHTQRSIHTDPHIHNTLTQIQTHTHIDTESHTHIQTHRSTHTYTHRHTDTNTHTDTESHTHTNTQIHT